MHHTIENSKWRNPHIRERKYRRRVVRAVTSGRAGEYFSISYSILHLIHCIESIYTQLMRNSLRLIPMIGNHPTEPKISKIEPSQHWPKFCTVLLYKMSANVEMALIRVTFFSYWKRSLSRRCFITSSTIFPVTTMNFFEILLFYI